MNIAEIVQDVVRASQAADAPQGLRDLVVEHAAGSPVELLAALVRWAAALDDDELAALPDDGWRAVHRAALAVATYRLHGLDQTAATLLTRRDPPPAPSPAETPPSSDAAA